MRDLAHIVNCAEEMEKDLEDLAGLEIAPTLSQGRYCCYSSNKGSRREEDHVKGDVPNVRSN